MARHLFHRGSHIVKSDMRVVVNIFKNRYKVFDKKSSNKNLGLSHIIYVERGCIYLKS